MKKMILIERSKFALLVRSHMKASNMLLVLQHVCRERRISLSMTQEGLPAHPTRSGFRREIQTSRETLSRRGSGWQTILQCTGFHQSERHAGE